MNRLLYIFLLLIFLGAGSACSTVKPYQRAYLNDPEMQMGGFQGVSFEDYVYAIRTGSIVAGSKKATGGCGCN